MAKRIRTQDQVAEVSFFSSSIQIWYHLINMQLKFYRCDQIQSAIFHLHDIMSFTSSGMQQKLKQQ